jgi:hypothetical protein
MIIKFKELKNKLLEKVISQIKLQQYYYNNELIDESNIIYFCINNNWYSIKYDAGELFFEIEKDEIKNDVHVEGLYTYKIINYPIEKQLYIKDVDFDTNKNDFNRLTIIFEDNIKLISEEKDDKGTFNLLYK